MDNHDIRRLAAAGFDPFPQAAQADPTAKDCSKQYSAEKLGQQWPDAKEANEPRYQPSLTTQLRRRKEALLDRGNQAYRDAEQIDWLLGLLEDRK